MERVPSRFSPSDANTPSELPETWPFQRLSAAGRQKRLPLAGVKTVYLDDDGWVALATARGWHLPQKNTQASSAGVAPWLRRLGLDKPKFREWCGYGPAEWCAHNPTWSLRALVGLLLEDFAPEAEASNE